MSLKGKWKYFTLQVQAGKETLIKDFSVPPLKARPNPVPLQMPAGVRRLSALGEHDSPALRVTPLRHQKTSQRGGFQTVPL